MVSQLLLLAALAGCSEETDGAGVVDSGSDLLDQTLTFIDGLSTTDQGAETGRDGTGEASRDGSTGPGQFGDRCSIGLACASGLTCLATPGSLSGFCSYTCATPLQVCSNAPAGTMPMCLYADSASHKLYCVFVCIVPGPGGTDTKYLCPSTLICSQKNPYSGVNVGACIP